MRDFTVGSLTSHLIATAVPIAAGMLFQTLYYLVDLYFVGRLGDAQLAGVSAAGVVMYIFLALTQVLSVGTVALVSHAVGRKNKSQAILLFNQSLTMSMLFFVVTLVIGLLLAPVYIGLLAADDASRSYGLTYLYWYIPGMALQFGLVSMGGALRGTGVVKPTMQIQGISVLINIILSPVLINGWGTGYAFGVAGAALASTISVAAGVLMLGWYFYKADNYIRVNPLQWKPVWTMWWELLKVGVPAGGEFFIMFILIGFNYWLIQDFGIDAQAGFGVGTRIIQIFFLPSLSIAFALASVAGQNYGANRMDRVNESFKLASLYVALIMLLVSALSFWQSERLSAVFSKDPQVIEYSRIYIQIIMWNFVTTGLIFTCSSLFQALGNTVPALLSSMSRLLTFILPAIYLSRADWFEYEHIWYLSIASMTVQCALSLWLARRQMVHKTKHLIGSEV